MHTKNTLIHKFTQKICIIKNDTCYIPLELAKIICGDKLLLHWDTDCNSAIGSLICKH